MAHQTRKEKYAEANARKLYEEEFAAWAKREDAERSKRDEEKMILEDILKW